MDKLKRIVFLIVFSIMQLAVWAQSMDKTTEEPTDFMRSNGKIYVVVACVVVIVLGIYIYLINLDRKISKLEDKA
ncbi:CcmD family protein [Panacibacter microcysteis]|nr:CcmD family protein [Panacibacter microcysteis]